MMLLSFSVAGYKNLIDEVRLDVLGPINVVHGDNNIGKSNLLEAVHLFFRLLSRDVSGVNLPLDSPVEIGALHGDRRLAELARLVARANDAMDVTNGPRRIRLVVSALAHAEKLYHLRWALAAKGRAYDTERIREGLLNMGLEVVDFLVSDGDGFARRLAERFETPDAWRDAERRNAMHYLGVGEAPGRRAPATVDWFIGGQAFGREWLLITDDRGPEFSGLVRKAPIAKFEAALRAIVTGPNR